MFLKSLELTQALLPQILPDEIVLMIQDNVGLYEGKYKLPNHQNGKVYLTSHRICYVDHHNAKKYSIALNLKDVDRFNSQSGFLKSSAKVILYPKPLRNRTILQTNLTNTPSQTHAISPTNHTDSPYRSPPSETPLVASATWICTICTFSNPVPRGFDPQTATIHTPLDPCKACGIKPTLAHVLKAAISNATGHRSVASPINSPMLARPTIPSMPSSSSLSAQGTPVDSPTLQTPANTPNGQATTEFNCPRCTFLNHSAMRNCEICGAPLISDNISTDLVLTGDRTESPGPVSSGPVLNEDSREPIKFSFRGGGEKQFLERLRTAIIQRKWISVGAPPVSRESVNAISSSRGGMTSRVKVAGVAGLEQRVGNQQRQNEVAIGTAFEDLQSLMASAKEIIALAENFARQANGNSTDASFAAESVAQLGIVATKDITGGSNSENLYLSELSRNIAEYLLDDSLSILKKAGGIIALVDLWAMFNRARGGVELVSPNDFAKAVQMWEKLHLPVRLRQFKSGVLVVQSSDRTDEATIKTISLFLEDLHHFPPESKLPWDWKAFGRGVTAQEVAERFGWSIGVAEEELVMAEEKGVVCREGGIEGIKYWLNYIDTGEYNHKRERTHEEEIIKALRESGLV